MDYLPSERLGIFRDLFFRGNPAGLLYLWHVPFPFGRVEDGIGLDVKFPAQPFNQRRCRFYLLLCRTSSLAVGYYTDEYSLSRTCVLRLRA